MSPLYFGLHKHTNAKKQVFAQPLGVINENKHSTWLLSGPIFEQEY